MSKLLFCLVLIQTLLLIFLSSKFLSIDEQLKTQKNAIADAPTSELLSQNNKPSLIDSALKQDSMHSLEDKFRQIVREELSQFKVAATQPSNSKPANQKQTVISEKQEVAYQAAQDTLDTFASLGHVNQTQLEGFYSSLGALTVEDRKEVIRRFTLSVNSGTIKVSQ